MRTLGHPKEIWMTRFIPVLLGVVVLTACQTMPRPLAPGELFTGRVLNIRSPNSEGWMQMHSSNQGMIFVRRGASPNETYAARVYAVALPGSKDRDEFVALVKHGYQ